LELRYKLFDIFFEKYDWLEAAAASGDPPVLLGIDLVELKNKRDDIKAPKYATIFTRKYCNWPLFQECLRPHVRHECGRYTYSTVSFKDHGVSLSFGSALPSRCGAIFQTCQWPELLSSSSERGRKSAYQVWGTARVVKTKEVMGMGEHARTPLSVSLISSVRVRYPDTTTLCATFWRSLHGDLLWPIEKAGKLVGWMHGDSEDEILKQRLIGLMARGRTEHCAACELKGDYPSDSFL